MTDQLIKVDANAVVLRQTIDQRWDAETAFLTLIQPQGAIMAPTVIIAKRGGGTGGSTFCLVLEYLTRTDALIIEVGGNPCAAFKRRAHDQYRHFPSRNPDRVSDALDLRLEHASRPAIIEFEPALYRDTVNIAASLRVMEPHCSLMVFYLAGTHETFSPYEDNARKRGLGKVFMCRQAAQGAYGSEERYLQLPWLDRKITSAIHGNALTITEALAACTGLWTKEETHMNLSLFATQILKRSHT